MEEPGDDEMSPMPAAASAPARGDDGRARRPVCKIFAYLAETYLVAPVPFALRWRRASEPPAGPPAAARGASSPEEEPRIPTLKIDWDEAGAPRPRRAFLGELSARGGPLDAGESPALISERGAAGADGMPPSRLGDGMACGGFDSVRCDAAACVGPGDAGATSCLSSTLDDAFAVPSRTAACLFGLDRLEDEAPRVKVPAARPAVAEEAAPVDDGDLVVPEMGDATAVAVALIALFFSLHEDIQDTIIEEVFVFLPLVSGSISERTPGLESAGEDVGAAFGIVVFGALVYVAWLAYRACGKATTRAAAALPRRKRDASGPAFRWPEDEPPPADVAGEDEKSPEDAVALVLFDGGGDGDRVEAARPDDDEAAAERPDDAASDGEFLDDEEIFLDADVQRADEAGPRARGRSATRGEGRASRSRSRSKSRSRSRRPGRGAMHRALFVVKAKGAVVRAGVALDSDKVVRLAAGMVVVVDFAEQLPDKKTRYLAVEPVVGWVSRGAVARDGRSDLSGPP
ncbi:hypothetical protein JL721_12207 [Aureococcus anophagefferens]|nr:hypothetical protein JL721_12207 [Aureococcus anophagefferens]